MHAINIVILTFTNRELIITLGLIKPFHDKEWDNKVIQKILDIRHTETSLFGVSPLKVLLQRDMTMALA